MCLSDVLKKRPGNLPSGDLLLSIHFNGCCFFPRNIIRGWNLSADLKGMFAAAFSVTVKGN